jgi:4-carboxymuconolactone decarboxylase
MMQRVQAVSDADFEERVLRAPLPVLVKFSAEWCGPCKQLAPLLEDIAAETADRLTVLELDIERNPAVTREYRVMSLPALLLFRDGALVKPVSAKLSKQQMIEQLELPAHGSTPRAAPRADLAAEPGSMLARGLAIRREVLGDAYVDRTLDGIDDFTRDFQALITEFCWGAIWGRDGLPRKTRSLINLAMLTALGRQEELKLHVRGAVTNGCTEREIEEALLQALVYCGVPAGVESFRNAKAVLGEIRNERATGREDDA